MMTLPPWLAALLADSPSMAAAMKAGKQTRISAVVFRACRRCAACVRGEPCLSPRREDLGTISFTETAWRATLNRWRAAMRGATRIELIRFTWRGRDYERPWDD